LNYQDFESAWYLGLIITSFFCVMLVGFFAIMRQARQLATEEGAAIALMAVVSGVFTFLFLLGICLALLVGIVVLAGG
jgi:predicted branched-subunit amino acid permease